MIRGMLVNYAATATVTATSDAGGDFGKDNIKNPLRPKRGARTAALGAQSWVLDLGAAKAMDAIDLIAVNFAQASIQADDASTFNSNAGLPNYDSGVFTIGPSPFTGVYQHRLRPVATVTRRWLRLSVPNQTPVDGVSYYRIGGLFPGAITAVGSDIFHEYTNDSGPAFNIIGPEHGSWGQYIILGDAIARITGKVIASVDTTMPASADSYAAWLAFIRAWLQTGYASISLRDAQPSWTHILRLVTRPTWTVDKVFAEASLEMVEVITS